jgi:hypothetical protein
MEDDTFEINICDLSQRGYIRDTPHGKTFRLWVIGLLNTTERTLFAKDIFAQAQADHITFNETLEEFFEARQDRYHWCGTRQRDENSKEEENVYADLMIDLVIDPSTPYYEHFFALHLASTDIFKVDPMLDYTYKTYYQDKYPEFARFVQLQLRKYGEKLIPAEVIDTANEWLASKSKELQSGSSETTIKPKPKEKLKREPGDNLTKLNQEQTALFFHLLQIKGIILRDDLLNNTETGQALSLLTGYSADALRQNFSKAELTRIASKKNLTDLSNVLTSLDILISQGLKNKK